jgi:NAD dependent epimerase/dehydratase family enzyme
MSAALAKAIGKPFFLPNVPAFLLKVIFGEKAGMLLASRKLSSKKIQQTGFSFSHPKIEAALNSLFPEKK